MSDEIKIFLSYSHKDEEYKKELDTFFMPFKNKGTVSTWNDRILLAGQNINVEINRNLLEANVIIFLISSDFLASEYILSNEFSVALERHKNNEALAIGVVIRDCGWKYTEIKDFLLLPEDAIPIVSSKENRDQVYSKVVDAVLEAAKIFIAKKVTQTDNKDKYIIITKNNEEKTVPYNIPLPHEHNINVKEEFFVKKMRDFTNQLYEFTINSEGIIAEQKEAYIKLGKYPTSQETCDNILVFFQSICRSVNEAFFYFGGARTHFRYLHVVDEKYLKLAAALEDINYKYAMTPMPSVNDGMIYYAAQFGTPLIYSLNKMYHYPKDKTLEGRDFKDYITFVLTNEDFTYRGEYLLSMGVSFKNPDRHRDFYYLMNICRFDEVIVNIVKSYVKETNIDVVDTIVKNCDYIKQIYKKIEKIAGKKEQV